MQLVVEILQIAGLVFVVLIILAIAARATLRKRDTRKSARVDPFGADAPSRGSDER
ncbi:MAG TPA: hypothetical protein VKQ06_06665 [Gammaproteobacteria bacterium]|nr:hypothetical protein [Gammaproteobacteria bacterium]